MLSWTAISRATLRAAPAAGPPAERRPSRFALGYPAPRCPGALAGKEPPLAYLFEGGAPDYGTTAAQRNARTEALSASDGEQPPAPAVHVPGL